MTLVLEYAARSDRGLVRGNNEDSVYAGARLLALADGMGGHAAGEVASQLMIAALAPLDDDEPGGDILAMLESATRAGNATIAEHVEEEPELEGMGTTLTAILFAGSRLGLVHIGDSRAYLARDGELTQITRDDTFVQSLVDQGRITAEQAKSHPRRSMIMRALTGNDIEPTLTMREARAGDRYLLCSDGLSDVVSAETIAETMRTGDHRECADTLIELALRSGGPDNITVIVADVIDLDYGRSMPIVGGAASDEEEPSPPPDTAAGRAAAMRPPAAKPRRVIASDPPPPPKKRHWGRIGLIAAGIVVLLGIAAAIAAVWIRSSYYVGESDGVVAIHRGIPGSVLGIPMQSVQKQGCVDDEGTLQLVSPGNDPADCAPLTLDDLRPSARTQVRSGLPGGSLSEAQQQIGQLVRSELLPLCSAGPSTAPSGGEPQPGGGRGSTGPDTEDRPDSEGPAGTSDGTRPDDAGGAGPAGGEGTEDQSTEDQGTGEGTAHRGAGDQGAGDRSTEDQSAGDQGAGDAGTGGSGDTARDGGVPGLNCRVGTR